MTLSDLLRDEIARRGPIPFRDFMERALYDPEHGYYASGRARIGRSGDFFTNVSVGPLFGAMLARQFEEMWQPLDCPDAFTIVEQGAHDGQLAFDVLSGLHLASPVLHERCEYVIVEPAPRSRAAQREKIDGFHGTRVRWVASIAELPRFAGVHISNELIDAFPVHLVKWNGTEWVERHVTWQDGRFAFVDGVLSDARLNERLSTLPPLPPGYITEINLAACEWIEALAQKLERGYVLAIDYGFPRDEYFRAHRVNGTLSACAAHCRDSNPLARPGEIDLTAHVEFTTLAEAAERAGLKLEGFTDQHHFMVGLSRLHFGEAETSAADLRAFKTLMHPELMGRSFRAICFSHGVAPARPLSGFEFATDPQTALGLGAPG